MRSFSVLIGQGTQVRPPVKAVPTTFPAGKSAVRMLDEQVRDLFHSACAAGDLDAAGDILSMTTAWIARRPSEDDQTRRDDAAQLLRMRSELERRYIMKGMRPKSPLMTVTPVPSAKA